jgi:hypothetical protein
MWTTGDIVGIICLVGFFALLLITCALGDNR